MIWSLLIYEFQNYNKLMNGQIKLEINILTQSTNPRSKNRFG